SSTPSPLRPTSTGEAAARHVRRALVAAPRPSPEQTGQVVHRAVRRPYAPTVTEQRAAAPEDDHALAGRLATEAGELLVELRADAFAAGAHPWQVMDEGDMRAHHFLAHALHEARPD